MAIEEDLSEWEIAPTRKMYSYAFGYVAVNFFLYGGWGFVFYYYQVELGLSLLYITLASIIFAIWNMINDPLLGFVTEKPTRWTKKYGFRAPWVVISAIPILIFYVLIWVPPVGASQLTLFIWFILITCLFDTFFSIFNDHVYGGYTNQFPTEYERRRSFAITTVMMFVVITFLTVISSFMIVYGDTSSFINYAIIAALVILVMMIILFLGVKESEEMKQMFLSSYEKADDVGFFKTMKTSLKTKNFTVSLIGYTSQITAMTLWTASGIYMYQYVYRLPFTMSALPTIVGVICVLATIPFWSNYARKHGFKKTYWVAFLLHGLAFIPFLFITDYLLVIIFTGVMYVFYCGEVIMLMPVASDTYDEVSSQIGRRVDATLVGVRTFFFRVAFFVQAVVFFAVFTITTFNPAPGVVQSPLAVWGIRVNAALIPMCIFIVMSFIFRKYYSLEGAEKEALVKKLKDMGIYR